MELKKNPNIFVLLNCRQREQCSGQEQEYLSYFIQEVTWVFLLTLTGVS